MDVKASKFMALLLRHEGQKYGLQFQADGYTSLSLLTEILQKNLKSKLIDEQFVESLVENDAKQRYQISGNMIRANQGHSGKVAESLDPEQLLVKLSAEQLPQVCIHGTFSSKLESIIKDGLLPMSRQFVHLTAGELEDVKSGYRHDATVKIYVDLRQMAADDISIYQSSNDVILIQNVKPKYFQKILVKQNKVWAQI